MYAWACCVFLSHEQCQVVANTSVQQSLLKSWLHTVASSEGLSSCYNAAGAISSKETNACTGVREAHVSCSVLLVCYISKVAQPLGMQKPLTGEHNHVHADKRGQTCLKTSDCIFGRFTGRWMYDVESWHFKNDNSDMYAAQCLRITSTPVHAMQSPNRA